MLTSHHTIQNKSIPCHHLTRFFFSLSFSIALISRFNYSSARIRMKSSSYNNNNINNKKCGKKVAQSGNNNRNDNQSDENDNKPKLDRYVCAIACLFMTERCFWFEFIESTNQTRMNVCSWFSSLHFVCGQFSIHVDVDCINTYTDIRERARECAHVIIKWHTHNNNDNDDGSSSNGKNSSMKRKTYSNYTSGREARMRVYSV